MKINETLFDRIKTHKPSVRSIAQAAEHAADHRQGWGLEGGVKPCLGAGLPNAVGLPPSLKNRSERGETKRHCRISVPRQPVRLPPDRCRSSPCQRRGAMPAKRRGEADARALLKKFSNTLNNDDSPVRTRRPGGSGLAAVRSAAAAAPSISTPTSWVAAWGLVPHLPAAKKSGPRRSARATPAAVAFRASICEVACGQAGVVLITDDHTAIAAPAAGGRRRVGCSARQAAVGETVALLLDEHTLYAVDPTRDAPRNGSWERPRRLDPFAGAPFFAQARRITGIACGASHCLARSSCGTVFAWGSGDAGQLGDDDGHDVTRSKPTPVAFPEDYEPCAGGAIAAGAHHSAVVDGAGALWTWGWTEHGRLGRDSVEEDEDDGKVSGTPGVALLPGGGACVDVACGNAHTIVADVNGFVSGCGWNEWGQASGRTTLTSVWHLTPVRLAKNAPFSAIKVAAGLGHSVAVDAYGTAKAWGFGEDGQLGHGLEASGSIVDVDLARASLRNGPACIVSIACGGSASVAVVAEAVGDGLEALRRRKLVMRRGALWMQKHYRGAVARRRYAELLQDAFQERLNRLRRVTDLGIESRDPVCIQRALQCFEDDVEEDAQRAREALRRLACRAQLEEALACSDDDASVALVDMAPDHDGDVDALRSGGRRPPRALAGVLCEDAAELCGLQTSSEMWRDGLAGYREAKVRLAERAQQRFTAALTVQLWWRGSLGMRLALAELLGLRERRNAADRAEAERLSKRDAEDQMHAATACQALFRGRAARLDRDAEVARRLGIRVDAATALCGFARTWRARRYLKRMRARARRLAREAAKRRERELAERMAAKQKPKKRVVPKKKDPMHRDAVDAARAAREAAQLLKKLAAREAEEAAEAAQNAREALNARKAKRDRDRRARQAAERMAEKTRRARAEASARAAAALAEAEAQAEADLAAAAAEEAAATPPTPPAPRKESFPEHVHRRRKEKHEEPTAPLPKKRPAKFRSVDEWASKAA